MSHQSAKIIARSYLQRLGIEHADLHGITIKLSEYQDQPTLDFLQPGNTWTLEFHGMVNNALAREMKNRGAKVDFVPIILDAYFAWLAKFNLPNTPANRAQFISWMTAPDPKPDPLKAP